MRYLQSDSRLSTLPFNFRLVRGGSVGPMNMIEFLPHSSSAFVNHHVHIGKQITNLCYISIIVFCIRLRSGILFLLCLRFCFRFFFCSHWRFCSPLCCNYVVPNCKSLYRIRLSFPLPAPGPQFLLEFIRNSNRRTPTNSICLYLPLLTFHRNTVRSHPSLLPCYPVSPTRLLP